MTTTTKILTACAAFGFAAGALVGCGADEAKRTGSDATSADAIPALDCGGVGATLDLAGSGSGSADSPLRHVPADQLRLVSGNTVTTVCDVFRAAKAKMAIFQFTGVACYPCMKAVDAMNTSLDEAGYGDDVLRVAVELDPIGSLSPDNEKRIKADVAPNATWLYDDFQDMWKFFAPGTATDPLPGAQPLAVVMDAAARGYVIDASTFTGPNMVKDANTQFGLDVQPTPPAKK